MKKILIFLLLPALAACSPLYYRPPAPPDPNLTPQQRLELEQKQRALDLIGGTSIRAHQGPPRN